MIREFLRAVPDPGRKTGTTEDVVDGRDTFTLWSCIQIDCSPAETAQRHPRRPGVGSKSRPLQWASTQTEAA